MIADAEAEIENLAFRDMARFRGWRSRCYLPLRDDTSVIGWISIARKEAGKFAEKDVELLQTFADQAVIAIQNVGCSMRFRRAPATFLRPSPTRPPAVTS